MFCNKLNTPAFPPPQVPSLPRERAQSAPVFKHTGVDYFGPLMVTDSSKVWVLLFTCLCTHAIHLELVKSLSAVSFINACYRFVAQRGKPQSMISPMENSFYKRKKFLTLLYKKIFYSQLSTQIFQLKMAVIGRQSRKEHHGKKASIRGLSVL